MFGRLGTLSAFSTYDILWYIGTYNPNCKSGSIYYFLQLFHSCLPVNIDRVLAMCKAVVLVTGHMLCHMPLGSKSSLPLGTLHNFRGTK